MRTLLAVLAAAVLATAAAAEPPTPQPKTFDVGHLIGDDGPFTTAEELRAVVKAFFPGGEGCCADAAVRCGCEPKLTVRGHEQDHRRVQQFLDAMHEVKRRRNTVVEVETLLFIAEKGFGETALLPKEGEKAVVLTAKETALTTNLLRLEKANGRVDVLSRPSMLLAHGREGCFQVGQQVPTVTATAQTADGTVLRLVGHAECGLTQKVTATVCDGDKVKLVGSVGNSEAVMDRVCVTHRGEFAAEVPAGGTMVTRVPTMPCGTGREMYAMLTVKAVGPAKKVGEPKAVVVPQPVPLPQVRAEGPGRVVYDVSLTDPPSFAKVLRVTAEPGVARLSAGELARPTPMIRLTRTPFGSVVVQDGEPVKPFPADAFRFWVGWISGQ